MRITTTMLNATSRETGIPIGSSSMMDYVNQNSNSANLLNALQGSKENVYDTVNRKNYEKLGSAAESLFKSTEGFRAEDGKDYFTTAKETGDYKEVYDEIAGLAEHYNHTMAALKGAPGALNNYYSVMLSQAAAEKKDLLNGFGIHIGKDGKMSVDTGKLKDADKEQLEKVFGKDSDFMKRLAFLSDRISDNAQSYTSSISNQYNAAGNTYSANSSKYDFLG